MEIRVGSEAFKTKKALRERIQKMLHSAVLGVDLGEPEHGFLLELLKNHPEAETKVGMGVKAFRVRTSPYKDRQFWITRTDGDSTEFSYIKCVSAPNLWTEFMKTLRRSIEPQIRELKEKAFSRKKEVPCPISGKLMTRRQAHADHIHPDTFEALANRFFEMEKLNRNNLPLGPSVDGQVGRMLADAALEARWQEFHRKDAKVRIISEAEHRKFKNG